MLILECCLPHRAAKQFVCEDHQWRKGSDYDCGTWYRVEQFEPRSLDDLADLVPVCRALPAHYAVRGKLSALGAKLVASGRTIRRCHTTETIPVPHIEDAPSQPLMVDVDKYTVPAGMRVGSEALIRHIIRDLLPPEFHDASCVWSLSSSAGLTAHDIIGCHLWYWLAEPVTSKVAKETFKLRAPKVDSAVLTPSQPHYTVDPILYREVDGKKIRSVDPLRDCRSGVISGEPSVRLEVATPPAPARVVVPPLPLLKPEEKPDTISAPVGELIPQWLVEKALAREQGVGKRLWYLLYAAATRAIERQWQFTAADLAAAAKVHPTFNRNGLEREAERAIEHARTRVVPLNALERERQKLRWQLSQPC